jgi:hypothetical protein
MSMYKTYHKPRKGLQLSVHAYLVAAGATSSHMPSTDSMVCASIEDVPCSLRNTTRLQNEDFIVVRCYRLYEVKRS